MGPAFLERTDTPAHPICHVHRWPAEPPHWQHRIRHSNPRVARSGHRGQIVQRQIAVMPGVSGPLQQNAAPWPPKEGLIQFLGSIAALSLTGTPFAFAGADREIQ